MRAGGRGARAAGVAAAVLTSCALATAARSQEISAGEAVRRALVSSPVVALAEQQVAAQEAALQRANGVFDGLVGFRSAVDYGVDELVGRRLRSEIDRRVRLEIPPPVLEDAADRLIAGIPTDASLLLPSSCLGASSFIALGGGETILCVDDDGNLLGILSTQFVVDPSIFGTASLARAFAGIEGFDERLQVFVDLLQAAASDQLRLVALILRRTADSLRYQRIRLGQVPTDSEAIRLDLALDHQYRFRNGSALVSTLSAASTEANFRGKPPLDPSRGDSALPNVFRIGAGIALDLPLGRGGGRTSFEAPALASEKGLEASRDLLAHTAAERALAALQAYWDTAAAARRVELLEESRETQQRLLGATQELVDADVVPRVDLELNRARLAEVESSVAGARQALEVARAELVRTIGLDAGELAAGVGAPSGLEEWVAAESLSGAQAAEWTSRALAQRRDVAAAQSAVEANRILAEAARSDLRPEVALSLNLSYNAFRESFQERFYDPSGFEKTFRETVAGPSYGIALRFRLPIGNNAARGRLLQAESASASSEIDATELRRSIHLGVVEVVAAAERARAELEARREALEQIEETQRATLERFRFGDLTVLDTLITESQLTGARLDVLAAERALLSLLARLRFEAGALIELEAGRPVAEARLLSFDEPVG